MQHDLERLGPLGFQNLAAALAVAEFGSQVQVLGAGRDGGRDMLCSGTLVWAGSEEQPGDLWDGYTVFQAKHKQRLEADPGANLRWLWQQVRSELKDWADPESGRDPIPHYWVIVTNVLLTPVPESGGFDTLNSSIRKFIEDLADDSRDLPGGGQERREKLRRIRRLRKWRIWDGNQVDALVTKHDGVRGAFPAFLTASDVFANLAQYTDRLPLNELQGGLFRHARTTLMGERAIYFDEAGAGDTVGTPIEQVAIDLPITPEPGGQRRTVFGHILDRGERVLRPRLNLYSGPRHVVVAGGPGNGKTTMSKFLVQAYRAALLEGAEDLSTDHHAVIGATAHSLRELGRDGLPKHRRWPMRIDLAEYAEERGLDEDSTLLSWIAKKVSARSNQGSVTPSSLFSWMQQWPWFLVLDGLDEVTEPRIRKRLIHQITEFVSDADGDNCDLLVVVTTRPTGYVENIAPTQFERIDLSRLSIEDALRYGILATRVRLKDDREKIERIGRRLLRAADDESLRYLMQTPLQVLIMTIIVEGAGHLAPDRYSLFWGYYETVFKRERNKQTSLARLLQEHANTILVLHQHVGFELQVRSERDTSTATMPPEELRHIAWKILTADGYRPSDTDSELLSRIFTAATHRLVLLTPVSRGHEGLGFDVRSLQELMAARYLTTGSMEQITDRLRTAAASPHWRNTWIFATGKLFAEPQPHQHDTVVSLIETIDTNATDRLGQICPIAPSLALDLIDDGMARSIPLFHDRLLAVAFGIFRLPLPSDPLAVAGVLVRAATGSDHVRTLIAEGLRNGLSDIPVVRETTQAIQDQIETAGREAKAPAAVRGLSGVRGRPYPKKPETTPEQAWQSYRETLTLLSDSAWAHAVEQADEAFRTIAKQGSIGVDVSPVLEALLDHDAAVLLELALESLLGHEPQLMETLRKFVVPMLHRSPVGEQLR
ncbi:NACHT domain-containing protein [Nocardia carnea]|uniref:NACHT domain-containing protein n=1 Tax=Nocardia carnea TaxID=37328 RepID=UPI0005276E18|nr:hypothetical protein [Nocardia carnea]